MKRRKCYILVMLVMLMMVLLGGCGVKKLSGRFVNESDTSEYYQFSGESKVKYCNSQGSQDGNYRIVDGIAMIYFGEGDEAYAFLEVKNKKTLYEGMTAYVKMGFFKRYGKTIAIIFGILCVIYGVMAVIYKMVTGRNLGEDMDDIFG